MNKIVTLLVILASISLLTPNPSIAQQGIGCRGYGCSGDRMYNRKTIETLKGEVVSIDTTTTFMPQGLHLLLKIGKETIPVHLGPSWFIQNQGIKIQPQDKIEVTGYKISFAGQPTIVAASVKKGDAILTLRDENGFPVWRKAKPKSDRANG